MLYSLTRVDSAVNWSFEICFVTDLQAYCIALDIVICQDLAFLTIAFQVIPLSNLAWIICSIDILQSHQERHQLYSKLPLKHRFHSWSVSHLPSIAGCYSSFGKASVRWKMHPEAFWNDREAEHESVAVNQMTNRWALNSPNSKSKAKMLGSPPRDKSKVEEILGPDLKIEESLRFFFKFLSAKLSEVKSRSFMQGRKLSKWKFCFVIISDEHMNRTPDSRNYLDRNIQYKWNYCH